MKWEKVKLGEVIDTLKGYAFSSQKYVDIGVKIIRVSNFTTYSIDDSDLKYYPVNEAEQHRKYLLGGNDVLIQTVGSWESNPDSVVGKVVRVPKNLSGALLNQNIVKIFPKDDEKLNKDFLFYRLRCNDFRGHNIGNATGAANQASITLKTINDFEFMLPPLELQKHIASILSAYDDLIENNQKQIKLLEEAAQRLYKEWFVDLRFPGHEDVEFVDGLPSGWSEKLLIDVAEIQYGYSFDGKLFNSIGEGNPIVRIRNIPDGVTSDFTTEEADNDYIIHNGDIVVGMDGEFHINSWCGDDAYLVQRTCSIRPYDENMKGFILQAVYEPIKFFEATLVGATVAHLGKKHLDTIKIKIAPGKLLCPFQEMFKQRQCLLNQNRMLAEARDRLLPKLMSGEVEV